MAHKAVHWSGALLTVAVAVVIICSQLPKGTPVVLPSTPAADALPLPAALPRPLGAERSPAAIEQGAVPPIPRHAQRALVQVVDRRSGAAVAGAEVLWIDASIADVVELPHTLRHLPVSQWRQLAERHGWRTRSDAEGRAVVHLGEDTCIVAIAEDRLAAAHRELGVAPPPGGLRLELEPVCTLAVQVVDAAGRAAAGVPIEALPPAGYDWDRQPRPWHGEAVTDAGGRAALGCVPTTGDGPPGAAVASAGIDVSTRGEPGTTLLLRLPPTGTLRVGVEHAGSLLAGLGGRVKATWRATPGDAQARELPFAADGWAVFPHVAAGLPIAHVCALVQGASLFEWHVSGPAAAATATVLLHTRADACLVTARVCDAAGAPVQGAALHVSGDDMLFPQPTQTDDHGCCRFLARRGDAAQVVDYFCRQDLETLRSAKVVCTLSASTVDLGEVRLRPQPLVVAGCFRCGSEVYAPGCSLSVERRVGSGWTQVEDLEVRKAAHGRFAVHGDAGPGPLRLLTTADACLPNRPIEFEPGARDVEVQVVPGSSLTATLQLPAAATSTAGWTAALLSEAVGAAAEPLRVGRTTPHADAIELHWSAVAPGSYRLELQLWCEPMPLLAIEHVLVPPPPGGDPRLAGIDLRDRLAVLHFDATVRSDRTDVVTKLGGGWAVPLQMTGRTACATAVTGSCMVPDRAIDFVFGSRGYRPVTVRGARGKVAIELEPWPNVELDFRELPVLPAAFGIAAALLPELPPTAAGFVDINSGEPVDRQFAPPTDAVAVENGIARVPIGDGASRLRVVLRRLDREGPAGEVELVGTEPALVRQGEGPLRVRVPPAELQQAIERLRN